MPPDLRRCAGVRDRDSVLGSPTYRERRMLLESGHYRPTGDCAARRFAAIERPSGCDWREPSKVPAGCARFFTTRSQRPMLSALAVRPAPTSGLAARRLAHAAVVAGGPPDGVPASAAPRCLGLQVQPNVAPRGLLGRGLASAAWLRPVPGCAPTAPAARRAASRQHAPERARAAPAPPVACRPCVPERAV